MNKIEFNDNYINDIITGSSDIFTLKWQEELEDGNWSIVLMDQSNACYQGVVSQNDKGEYSIVGDTEFDKVYPVFNKDTGKIVKINS
tara:strand:- start:2196 stop:2456 length:261 start_codon:yes stop_codon:yes gene_type:complete